MCVCVCVRADAHVSWYMCVCVCGCTSDCMHVLTQTHNKPTHQIPLMLLQCGRYTGTCVYVCVCACACACEYACSCVCDQLQGATPQHCFTHQVPLLLLLLLLLVLPQLLGP